MRHVLVLAVALIAPASADRVEKKQVSIAADLSKGSQSQDVASQSRTHSVGRDEVERANFEAEKARRALAQAETQVSVMQNKFSTEAEANLAAIHAAVNALGKEHDDELTRVRVSGVGSLMQQGRNRSARIQPGSHHVTPPTSHAQVGRGQVHTELSLGHQAGEHERAQAQPTRANPVSKAPLSTGKGISQQEASRDLSIIKADLGTIEAASRKFQAEQNLEQAEEKALGTGSMEARELKEEDTLLQEERTSLGRGLNIMAHAANDPRGFLMQLPGIDKFVAGLKVAVELSPDKGYCLQHGEFMGYGCINDGKSQPICECRGRLEQCWVETDEQKLMSAYQVGNTEEAMEHARAILFGQCFVPLWVRLTIGLGGLALLTGLAVAAKKFGSGRLGSLEAGSLGSWEAWRRLTFTKETKSTEEAETKDRNGKDANSKAADNGDEAHEAKDES